MHRIIVETSYAAISRDLLEGITYFVRERPAPWEIHCVTTAEIPAALKHRPAGALCTLGPEQSSVIAAVQSSRVPTVNMFRDIPSLIPSVYSDHEAIGSLAANYFRGLGFRNFAYLGPDREWSLQRLHGFRRALAKHNLTAHDLRPLPSIATLRDEPTARFRRALLRFLGPLPKPLALFAAADFAARACLFACREARWRIAEEVAVLGVDNDLAICELAPVSLSSIPQNLHRMGFEAARLLDALIKHRPAPRKPVLIPPREVVVRRSTDRFVFQDPRVSRTLALIHGPQGEHITIPQILRETGVSRQWLDRRFKQLLGHTPSHEIRRLKLDHVRKLLAETHLTIHAIAQRTGFRHAENLTRFFRDQTGQSPTQFRQTRQP